MNNKFLHVWLAGSLLSLVSCGAGLQVREDAPIARARLQLISSNAASLTSVDSLSFDEDDPSLEYQWIFETLNTEIGPIGYASGPKTIDTVLVSLNNGGALTVTGTYLEPVLEYAGPAETISINYCLEVRDVNNFESLRSSCGQATLAPIQPQICTETDAFAVGGSVSGLPSGGRVQITNVVTGSSINVGANGGFSLPGLLSSGDSYEVTVTASGDFVSCSVDNESGTIESANVSDVAVTCQDQTPQLGANFQGRYCGDRQFDIILRVDGMARGIFRVTDINPNVEDGPTQIWQNIGFSNQIPAGANVALDIEHPYNQVTCTGSGSGGVWGVDNLENIELACKCPGS